MTIQPSLRRRMMACACLWVVTTSGAQDVEKIAPKMLPALRGQVRLPDLESRSPEPENEAVLVGSLKAVVLLASPKQASPRGFEKARGMRLEGVEIPDAKAFGPVIEGYLGKPLSLGSVNRLTRDIVRYYRGHDRPVVDVSVPEQDITSGVLQLVVLESRAGTVQAKGNRWFSSRLLESRMRVRTGDPISSSRLTFDLSRLNDNPFREVNLVYTPGKEFGTTDLILETKDRFPLRFYAGYENTGNAATGYNRWLAGFNAGNVWGAGHQLSYQFTTGDDFQSLLGNVLTYESPLPWGHVVTLLGGYTETTSPGDQTVNSAGTSYQASLRYKIPLKPFGTLTQDLTAGFDFKRSNNNLEFGGTQVFSTDVDIFQWLAGYEGSELDSLGVGKLNATMFYSPGNLDGFNTNPTFQQARAYSNCRYLYLRAAVDRSTKLPWGFSLLTRGQVQWGDTNLQASEQFGLGGYSTVRGYEEGEVNGDSGVLFSTELRTPSFGLLPLLKRARKSTGGRGGGDESEKQPIEDLLQFLCFWDYGIARVHQTLPGEARQVNLSGIGAGLRYSVNPWLSLRFDYGWQMNDLGLGLPFTSRAYLGAVVSY